MHFQIPSAALLILGTSSLASAACVGPDVNQATLDLVKEFEGWYPDICTWSYRRVYEEYTKLTIVQDDDPVGLPTVGYGHLCSDASCSEVKYSIPLSKADGEKLLADDLTVRYLHTSSSTTSAPKPI